MKLKLQFLVVMFLNSIFTSAFACEAILSSRDRNGFVYRGAVGEPSQYIQQVYSAKEMSFSTVVFASKPNFEKNKAYFIALHRICTQRLLREQKVRAQGCKSSMTIFCRLSMSDWNFSVT